MGKKLIMFPIYTLNNGVQIPAIGREFSAKMLIYYSNNAAYGLNMINISLSKLMSFNYFLITTTESKLNAMK